MMSSVRAEAILTALVLAGTAGVATDYIDLPYSTLQSTTTTVLLVIVALLAFVKYPAVGLSLFQRNGLFAH